MRSVCYDMSSKSSWQYCQPISPRKLRENKGGNVITLPLYIFTACLKMPRPSISMRRRPSKSAPLVPCYCRITCATETASLTDPRINALGGRTVQHQACRRAIQSVQVKRTMKRATRFASWLRCLLILIDLATQCSEARHCDSPWSACITFLLLLLGEHFVRHET